MPRNRKRLNRNSQNQLSYFDEGYTGQQFASFGPAGPDPRGKNTGRSVADVYGSRLTGRDIEDNLLKRRGLTRDDLVVMAREKEQKRAAKRAARAAKKSKPNIEYQKSRVAPPPTIGPSQEEYQRSRMTSPPSREELLTDFRSKIRSRVEDQRWRWPVEKYMSEGPWDPNNRSTRSDKPSRDLEAFAKNLRDTTASNPNSRFLLPMPPGMEAWGGTQGSSAQEPSGLEEIGNIPPDTQRQSFTMDDWREIAPLLGVKGPGPVEPREYDPLSDLGNWDAPGWGTPPSMNREFMDEMMDLNW